MITFEEQMERVESAPPPESAIAAARAADRGEGPPVALEDPLRIARRAVSAGLAPTVGAVLAPSDGISTSDALAVAYERVLGEANFLGSEFLFAGVRRAEAVCRVVIRTPSGSVAGYGTGFMVGPSAVMTNNHVLESAATAGPSVIQFGYRERSGGTMHPVAEFALEPARLFVTDTKLDVTVVAVAASNRAGQLVAAQGWVPLIGPTGKTLVGERVNIIQHPSGQPQQVVIHDNLVVEVVDNFLRYVADTQPGSSGSPVFNNDWDLAALHHSGVPRKDDQGRILLTSGDVWDGSEAKRDLIDWVSNEGARVSSIVAFLQAQPASPELDAVLNPPPNPGVETASPGTARGIGTIGPAVGPRITGTTARWQVPVEVELDVAMLASPAAAAPPPAAAVSAPAAAAPVPATAGDADQGTAAATAAYYDDAADLLAIDAYYTSIEAEAEPPALYRQLHDLSATAHTRALDYAEARLDHLYPLVDLHEDGRLRSVYSDTGVDPRAVIEADLEVEAQRSARLERLVAGEAALTTERLEEFAAAIDAELFFNCEHVVPQSWFAKKQPMRGDLHHLFTCEPGCNSFRSNIPYFDFPPDLEAIRTANAQGNRNPFIDHPDWADNIDFAPGFAA